MTYYRWSVYILWSFYASVLTAFWGCGLEQVLGLPPSPFGQRHPREDSTFDLLPLGGGLQLILTLYQLLRTSRRGRFSGSSRGFLASGNIRPMYQQRLTRRTRGRTLLYTTSATFQQSAQLQRCARRLEGAGESDLAGEGQEGTVWRRGGPHRTAPATPAVNSLPAIDDDDDDVHQIIARIALALVPDDLKSWPKAPQIPQDQPRQVQVYARPCRQSHPQFLLLQPRPARNAKTQEVQPTRIHVQRRWKPQTVPGCRSRRRLSSEGRRGHPRRTARHCRAVECAPATHPLRTAFI